MILQLNSLAVPVLEGFGVFFIGLPQINTENGEKGKSNTGRPLANIPFVRQYSVVICPCSGHFRKGTK